MPIATKLPHMDLLRDIVNVAPDGYEPYDTAEKERCDALVTAGLAVQCTIYCPTQEGRELIRDWGAEAMARRELGESRRVA